MKDLKRAEKISRRKKTAKINTVLIFVCFLLLAVAALYIVRFYVLQKEVENDNQRLSDMYREAMEKPDVDYKITDADEKGTPEDATETEAKEQTEAPVIITYPRPPEEIAPEFEKAYEINPDVIGFLHIPAKTVDDIELFVVQKDNEYYLTHDFYGNEKKSGTLFLDQVNQIWPQDQHMIIYGHNMKNGTMFARLPRYKALEYAYNNPFVYFDTLYEKGSFVVLAAIRLPASEMLTEGFNLRTFTFGETSFKSFMYDVSQHALYMTKVGVNENDQLLSLVTCAYNEDDERFLLITRRIRENETEEELRKKIK
ncbi:MAG: class B sortase [Clostridia bacterium]|nr:class B sortase [Clostridia bacterium]